MILAIIPNNIILTNFCSMQVQNLTDNGIQKLLGSIPGVILQVLGVTPKLSNNQQYYRCDLSDGYSKYKGCLIVDEEIMAQKDSIRDFLVIKVSKSLLQQNKAQQPVVFVQKCAILNQKLTGQIGEPIPYQEFVKNGKQNPKGNNSINSAKKASLPKKFYQDLMQETGQQEERTVQPPQKNKGGNNSVQNQNKVQKKAPNPNVQSKQSSSNNNIKPGNRTGNLRLSNQEEQNSTMQQNSVNLKQNSNSNTHFKANQKSNQNSRQLSMNQGMKKEGTLAKPQNKKGPIERIPEKKEVGLKGNQRRPTTEYNLIKELFPGIENWTILGRVLFVYPVKSYINKKGVESSILKIQIGDASATIECTLFGEMAHVFDQKFKEDQIYQISNGIVNESNYMGKHELKITITQNTLVRLKEDDNADIPYTEELWITVKTLLQAPVNQTKTVICLVKDSGTITNLVSKAGKELRKKTILLCDPQAKVEVQATIWNDKCEETFELQPYIIKGVQIGQYNGNRQYTLKTNFAAKIAKQHKYRRYIKDLENISFSNPDSQRKQSRTVISNFKDLVNSMDEQSTSGVWSEIVCTVNTIKTSSKNYYLSCPSCKKKVMDETNGECVSCHAHYEQARPRYVLNVMLMDMYETTWVTFYDETAEILTGMPATQFSRLNEEGLQELLRKMRYKEIKVKLLTKNEEFNKETRKKTGVIKILKLDYAAETKSILSRLNYLMNG